MNATTREYFAAHAPTAIPTWFKPISPGPPRLPSDHIDLSAYALSRDERDVVEFLANGWRRDSCFSLAEHTDERPDRKALMDKVRPALVMYEERWEDYRDEYAEWGFEKDRQREAQWPWAWADLVLAASGAKGGGK